jgi:ubiquinone/menaquinone biosynthesis C-methylase UbiE/DNA-binding transcriptional ArsR family regulator
MQDPNFLKYIEHFERLPSARLYYYRVGKTGKGVTTKELSNRMGRSIQTVTNALRDLEHIGLLKSEKKGRERIYQLKDPRLFNGLIAQYTLQVQYAKKKFRKDLISVGVFNENLKKWLSYLADMMDGVLYINQIFKTQIIDTTVDYVIENKHGQHFIIFFHINNLTDYEAAIGRIFSLVTSKEIIPNLNILLIIGLVYDDEILIRVRDGFYKLSHIADKFEITSNQVVQKVQAGDIIKPDFSEKMSLDITSAMPFYSDEALPGEDWMFDISERRWHALGVIQDRINPKTRERIVVDHLFPLPAKMHPILPRDDELRKWLDPEKLLVSYGLRKGDVFVDVGCFEGLFTIPAAKIVGNEGRVYGIDLSPASLEKIKSYADQNNIKNILLKEGLPEKVKLDNKIADVVFFGTTLSDSYDPMKSLKNANRMLKDSGRLIVLEWKEGKLDAGPSDLAKLRKQRIIAYIENAGFIVEVVRDEGNYHYSIIAMKKNS